MEEWRKRERELSVLGRGKKKGWDEVAKWRDKERDTDSQKVIEKKKKKKFDVDN